MDPSCITTVVCLSVCKLEMSWPNKAELLLLLRLLLMLVLAKRVNCRLFDSYTEQERFSTMLAVGGTKLVLVLQVVDFAPEKSITSMKRRFPRRRRRMRCACTLLPSTRGSTGVLTSLEAVNA
jgi:hypothetical protein